MLYLKLNKYKLYNALLIYNMGTLPKYISNYHIECKISSLLLHGYIDYH